MAESSAPARHLNDGELVHAAKRLVALADHAHNTGVLREKLAAARYREKLLHQQLEYLTGLADRLIVVYTDGNIEGHDELDHAIRAIRDYRHGPPLPSGWVSLAGTQ